MDELPETGYDTNGDGIADAADIDTDGDGTIDAAVMDSDFDGIVDTQAYDVDGDGIAEIVAYDTLQDGTPDIISIDNDGDGLLESTFIDADNDADTDTITTDLDADGDVDKVLDDTDGDGSFESITEDSDGDGVLDVIGIDSDGDGIVDTETGDSTPFATEGGGVHGQNEDEWYQAQAENGQCVPTSVAMIVSEHTGEFLPYSDAVDQASDLGLLPGGPGEWQGMWAQQAESLLESYGVDAHVEHGDLDQLAANLDNGQGVIAIIDADEVWGTGDSASVNHAVVVVGVDEEAGTVILNDPGQPDGASFEVPIEQFMDAWADGGNQMVVTDDPAPDHDASADAEPFDLPDEEAETTTGDELLLGGYLLPT